MKTIKIIDLLNKIANDGKVPETIIFEGHKCKYDAECFDYFSVNKFTLQDTHYLFKSIFISSEQYLNNEVEILDEEDEFEDIEELNLDKDELLQKVIITAQDYVIEGKINELIKNQKKIIERIKNND